ncbi:hypothetical protein HDV03_001237 [Kappamyces sp. JEL0829]|nr:hypothetical protein HDV03_001237 [Kappamyces sp. JEL0829]
MIFISLLAAIVSSQSQFLQFQWQHSDCDGQPDLFSVFPDESFSLSIAQLSEYKSLDSCGIYLIDQSFDMQRCCYSNLEATFGFRSLARGYPYESLDRVQFPTQSQIAPYCVVDYSGTLLSYTLAGYKGNGACIAGVRCNGTHVALFDEDDCSGEHELFPVSDAVAAIQPAIFGAVSVVRFQPSKANSVTTYVWTTSYPMEIYTVMLARGAFPIVCQIIRFMGLAASLASLAYFAVVTSKRVAKKFNIDTFFLLTHFLWSLFGCIDASTTFVTWRGWSALNELAIMWSDYWLYNISILCTTLNHALILLDIVWMPKKTVYRRYVYATILVLHIGLTGGNYIYAFWPVTEADSYYWLVLSYWIDYTVLVFILLTLAFGTLVAFMATVKIIQLDKRLQVSGSRYVLMLALMDPKVSGAVIIQLATMILFVICYSIQVYTPILKSDVYYEDMYGVINALLSAHSVVSSFSYLHFSVTLRNVKSKKFQPFPVKKDDSYSKDSPSTIPMPSADATCTKTKLM